MGSKGGKPRKPQHSRHLPKVASATENEIALHEEREAILGQLGLRNPSSGVKLAFTAIVAVVVVAAILGLLFFVFR